MPPASDECFSWELPALLTPENTEHLRDPVQPSTPRTPWVNSDAVATPRQARDKDMEIRELLKTHSDALMERMETLMLQKEHAILHLLQEKAVSNALMRGSRSSYSSRPGTPIYSSAQGPGSLAETTGSLAETVGSLVETKKDSTGKVSKTVISFGDFRRSMKRALVMQQFAKRRAQQSLRKISWVYRWVTQSGLEAPKGSRSRVVRCAGDVVRSQVFDGICAAVIFLNAAFLGISTDIGARRANPHDLPKFFTYADRIFSIWFFLELFLRMFAHGLLRFFFGPECTWNVFDLLVVTTDLVETVVISFFGGSKSLLHNLTATRILRVLRITRTIRVLRLVRFFKELRMMIYSVLKSGLLLLWSMLLLTIILFIFSVYLTQTVTFHVYHETVEEDNVIPKLRDYFGSLILAGYMLFQCMSGGISWGEVGEPLLEIHWSNGLVLCFFIFFTVFAVLNIITGIFVDTARKSAQADRHEVIQEAIHHEEHILSQMQKFFEETDLDKSGTITLEELQVQLQSQDMRARLLSLGVEVNDASSMFRLLDIDKSGEITIQEFIYGCLQMKGTAKSIDLVALLHEHRRLKDQMANLFSIVQESLQQHSDFQQRIELLILTLRRDQQ